ncbi:MAG: hypothetical protein HS126_18740 [Anaerolineales bacterium]|nr:hypothetical protein [Anaerolineales bacterium]
MGGRTGLSEVGAGQLDQAGRKEQNILALADGAFDVLNCGGAAGRSDFAHPDGPQSVFVLVAATPFWVRGVRPVMGRRPHPAEWLHAGLRNWPKRQVLVRGKQIQMRYQCLGPLSATAYLNDPYSCWSSRACIVWSVKEAALQTP